MPREINIRKKLFEVRQTPGQFWLKVAFGAFWSIAVPLAIIVFIIAVGFVRFSWELAIVAGVIFMSSAMLKYMKITERLEATLYENGLIYTIGRETTEVAFKDIKGIQFSVITTAGGAKGYILSKITRPITLIEHDGTRVEMGGFFPVFRNFRRFYKELDSAFTDYLLKDTTYENIHQANISFGERLELRDGCFVYHEKNPFGPDHREFSNFLY